MTTNLFVLGELIAEVRDDDGFVVEEQADELDDEFDRVYAKHQAALNSKGGARATSARHQSLARPGSGLSNRPQSAGAAMGGRPGSRPSSSTPSGSSPELQGPVSRKKSAGTTRVYTGITSAVDAPLSSPVLKSMPPGSNEDVGDVLDHSAFRHQGSSGSVGFNPTPPQSTRESSVPDLVAALKSLPRASQASFGSHGGASSTSSNSVYRSGAQTARAPRRAQSAGMMGSTPRAPNSARRASSAVGSKRPGRSAKRGKGGEKSLEARDRALKAQVIFDRFVEASLSSGRPPDLSTLRASVSAANATLKRNQTGTLTSARSHRSALSPRPPSSSRPTPRPPSAPAGMSGVRSSKSRSGARPSSAPMPRYTRVTETAEHKAEQKMKEGEWNTLERLRQANEWARWMETGREYYAIKYSGNGELRVQIHERGEFLREVSQDMFAREHRKLATEAQLLSTTGVTSNGARTPRAISLSESVHSSGHVSARGRSVDIHRAATRTELRDTLLETFQLCSKLREQLSDLERKGIANQRVM